MERRSEMQRIAVLRETMIQQEVMFKEQVRELHRLYQKQKILMTGLSKLKAAELATMDLLQCLNNEQQQVKADMEAEQSPGIRVKRQKTLDLEQLPDDNDEDTEYIYEKPRESIALGLSKENSTLDFRELHRPTLSLFPLSNSKPLPFPNLSCTDQLQQNLGRTSDQIPAIAQPYNSTLRDPWWKSLGQDGARLIGQIVRECQQQDGMLPTSSHHPYGSMPQASVGNLYRNGLLESLQQQRSYNKTPWQHQQQQMASLAYSFNFKESLAPPPLLSPPPPPLRPTTFNGFSLEANRISWCSGNNFMFPGNNMKHPAPPPPVSSPFPDRLVQVPAAATGVAAAAAVGKDEKAGDGAMKGSEDAKAPTPLASNLVSSQVETGGTGTNDNKVVNRLLGASCTDTDSTADASADSDKQVLDLNKNIYSSSSSSNNSNNSDDTLVNNDTITWAATILLSLAPDNYKCSSHLSRVHEPSSLLSSDVKLFKSVVIMLKQSGGIKASKKLLVKSFNHGKGGGNHNHGKPAAAAATTLLETLKKSIGQEQEEEEKEKERRAFKQQRKEDKTKAVSRSSNGKKKSFTSWMWGDVTRKKRMQRHRSNHPQVQQVRCL